ncbi:P-loop containing nucleoside triphosphate hydrolase protein, partial [Lophium mytilinum]
DMFIAVMGVTGAGKSSFISLCSGQQVEIGHDLQACTSAVAVYKCQYSNSRTIYLIDTPGFDDTNRSDTEVLREIASWLIESYTDKVYLNGIIYLHRISDIRMHGSAKKNLLMFKKLCGPKALKNVILATTMWDRVTPEEGARREAQLKNTPEFWGWMLNNGSRICRHTPNRDAAMTLLEQFVQGESRVTLALQSQMVDEHMTLDQTGAGKELEFEIQKERAKFAQELREVQESMQEAVRARDKESERAMRELQDDYSRRMEELEHDRSQLKISMEKLHEERYAKLERMLKQQQE